jgi:hypothetical protein
MQPRTFQIKPKTTKAIQFIDKNDNAEYFAGQYLGLVLDGTTLYFDGDVELERVWDGDWLLLNNERVVEVIDCAVFENMYQEVK